MDVFIVFGRLFCSVFWGNTSPDFAPCLPSLVLNGSIRFLKELVSLELRINYRDCFWGIYEPTRANVEFKTEARGRGVARGRGFPTSIRCLCQDAGSEAVSSLGPVLVL